MDPRFLSDDERRVILVGRLRSLEREHYEQCLNREVGEALAASGVGGSTEEAHQMIAEADRAQAIVAATHELLTRRLEALNGAAPALTESPASQLAR